MLKRKYRADCIKKKKKSEIKKKGKNKRFNFRVNRIKYEVL